MSDYFLLALIGHPLSHSLSPDLHNAALQFAGLKGEYRLIDIMPKNFQIDLKKLLPKELKGFNVTIPYKEEIYRLLSSHSPEAKLTGAVNTVKVEKDGRLSGHNTDLLGFKQSFADAFNIDLHEKQALVVGAGGAAKAVVIGLAQMGVAKIEIIARDTNKANSFIDEIKASLSSLAKDQIRIPEIRIPEIRISETRISETRILETKIPEIVIAKQNDLNTNNNQIAVVINTSPIGMSDEAIPDWLNKLFDKLPANCVIFDLVYRKDKSKPTFAQNAIAKNFQAIDGLSMLAHQAKFSFKYWTGIDVPTRVFFESLGFKI